MDQCVVDVGHIPKVGMGDEVIIIGKQGEEQITVEEVASLADTINYEILCGLSPRVPKVYFKGGEIVQVQTLTDELEADQIYSEGRFTGDQR
jgi:alanine racemase